MQDRFPLDRNSRLTRIVEQAIFRGAFWRSEVTMQMYESDYGAMPVTDSDRFWKKFDGCVDYEVFICDLPELEDREWARAVMQLRAIGKSTVDVCGITTVRADWGFFLIPGRGYPEFKITFFQITPKQERRRVLDQLEGILLSNQENP